MERVQIKVNVDLIVCFVFIFIVILYCTHLMIISDLSWCYFIGDDHWYTDLGLFQPLPKFYLSFARKINSVSVVNNTQIWRKFLRLRAEKFMEHECKSSWNWKYSTYSDYKSNLCIFVWHFRGMKWTFFLFRKKCHINHV